MTTYTQEQLLKIVQWACEAQREDDAMLVRDYFMEECSDWSNGDMIMKELNIKLSSPEFEPDIDMTDIENFIKREGIEDINDGELPWKDIK